MKWSAEGGPSHINLGAGRENKALSDDGELDLGVVRVECISAWQEPQYIEKDSNCTDV